MAGGVDVLIAARHFFDRIYVHAAFVRKRGSRPRAGAGLPDVGDLVDELGQFLELGQRRSGQQRFFSFNGAVGITVVRLQLPVRSP